MSQTPEEQIAVIKATRKRLLRLRTLALLVRFVEITFSATGTVCAVVGFISLLEAYKQDGLPWHEVLLVAMLFCGLCHIVVGEFRRASLQPTRSKEQP